MGIRLHEGCILKSVIGLQIAFLGRFPQAEDFIPASILPREVSFLVIITPVLWLFFQKISFQERTAQSRIINDPLNGGERHKVFERRRKMASGRILRSQDPQALTVLWTE